MWREPTLHFLLLGLCLFAVEKAVAPTEESGVSVQEQGENACGEPSYDVVIDAARIEEIERLQTALLERAPNSDELELALEAWVQEEIRVREARRLGLDVGDPFIRAHLHRKLDELGAAAHAAPALSEEALRAHYEEHIERWSLREVWTLRQVSLPEMSEEELTSMVARVNASGVERVQEIAEFSHLEAPAEGPVLRGRDRASLLPIFGPDALREIERRSASIHQMDQTTGNQNGTADWFALRTTRGLRLVRIEFYRSGEPIPFEEARERVIAHWQTRVLDQVRTERSQRLEEQYRVVRQ